MTDPTPNLDEIAQRRTSTIEPVHGRQVVILTPHERDWMVEQIGALEAALRNIVESTYATDGLRIAPDRSSIESAEQLLAATSGDAAAEDYGCTGCRSRPCICDQVAAEDRTT